jgi:hypothetical protein
LRKTIINEEDLMLSEKMGRRKFMRNMSSALLGVVSSPFWSGLPLAHAEKKSVPEYRTLGKTGLKVTAVSMGVMNCNDPAVLLRAFDLGINFYDTADCYMKGRNEEMVGKAFEGKRQKVFIQTKVHAHDEKKMRSSVERSLRRLRTDYIDVLVWHDHSSPEEVHQNLKSGKALLVCAYEDEAKFKKMHLQGAISFNEFKSRLPSLQKDQEIVFY